MAVSKILSSQTSALREFNPRWPARGIEPSDAWVDYHGEADELMIYFERPTPAVSIPIDTPERDDVYLRVDAETEAVVGIQVDAFLTAVVHRYPQWGLLAGPAGGGDDWLSALTTLIADVAGLFALYGAGGQPTERSPIAAAS